MDVGGLYELFSYKGLCRLARGVNKSLRIILMYRIFINGKVNFKIKNEIKMPVLAEALSVIIKKESLERLYVGGFIAFLQANQYKTLCYDDDIVRVGFMTPDDVGDFIDKMTSAGLKYIEDDKALDMTVVDQVKGSLAPAAWLTFGKVNILIEQKPQSLSACKEANSLSTNLITPSNWSYDGSLSQKHSFVRTEELNKDVIFVGHKDGCDIYLNKSTGKKLYAGRSGK